MGDLTPDFSKRDCSLPAGCSDLLDMLGMVSGRRMVSEALVATLDLPVGPAGEVEIGPVITVHELAEKTGYQPYKILEKLIGDKVFAANPSLELTFAQASKVAEALGFCVKEVELG